MSQPARKTAAAEPDAPAVTAPAARAAKSTAFLVTLDDALWPQIGPHLEGECVLRQVDSLAELERFIEAQAAAVVLWDARDSAQRSDDLARLQALSSRLAVIVLDEPARAGEWKEELLAHAVSSVLSVPVDADALSEALRRARAGALASTTRSLASAGGEPAEPSAGPPRAGGKKLLIALAALSAAAAAGWYVLRGPNAPAEHSAGAPSAPPVSTTPSAPPGGAKPAAAAAAAHGSDEQVDNLLEKARQAMLDRHYIDPPEQNALAYYQSALLYDPANGEAQQGLERLAQILFARVQSDLDERRFDLALQALETARTIRPGDPHLKALDARIAALRAELGPAQIQAAINAKSFDRALQLLDEAGKAHTLSAARLSQLREELQRAQESSEAARFVKLLATRTQQDRLLEPREDNALYYLQQARTAGAAPSSLAEPTGALGRRLLADAHSALEQGRTTEAEALIDAARGLDMPAKSVAGLQKELAAARDAQTRERSQRAQWLETARNRIAQGALLTPPNDGALFYYNQAKSADAGSPEVGALGSALFAALLAQGRAALDAKDAARAQALAAAAGGIGSSADLEALKSAIAQQSAASAAPAIVPATSLVMVKPLKLEYPREALLNGTEGWVDLSFTVAPDGKVTDVSVVDASPKRVFDAAAKAAIDRTRYRPVTVDGRPIAVKASLHVTFRLDRK